MREVVVAAAVRTPIGRFGGGFVPLTAVDLGVLAAEECLKRSGIDPTNVDEAIFGHGRQGGNGTNTGRQVAYRSGVPQERPAMTVNMACASSLKAIQLAAQSIRAGESDVVLAGGMESMSNTPYFLMKARWGYRLGDAEVIDGQYQDGFLCPLTKDMMGKTAETLAEQYDIGRDEQDAYAVESQRRCEVARAENRFEAETFPVEVPGRKGPTIVDKDEHPRAGATVEGMAKLKPVFKKDGTVHAGNASGITDGGAAILVLAADAAERLNVTPMARITGWASAGVDPHVMGIGPVPAIRTLFEKTGLSFGDIDLIELNEAFAAQVIACHRDLEFDLERTNVNGGSIALGHPIGATGTRIVVTLLHEMARAGRQTGLASLCVSGGMGMAMTFERA
ncbi:MAG: acetyl-CoA C-acetyltransferase [Acidobacteria bacterium]|nr:acetyl-CoA C-acetyltransferase [Acidobacteriota bacterium]